MGGGWLVDLPSQNLVGFFLVDGGAKFFSLGGLKIFVECKKQVVAVLVDSFLGVNWIG